MAIAVKIIPILIAIGAVVILIIALVASSLRKLSSDQRKPNHLKKTKKKNYTILTIFLVGLQYDNIAKSLDTKAKNEGLYTGKSIDKKKYIYQI
jgi:hypothetical protein